MGCGGRKDAKEEEDVDLTGVPCLPTPEGEERASQVSNPWTCRFNIAIMGNRVQQLTTFSDKVQASEKASFTIKVYPSWAPLGAARFRELCDCNYFDGVRFYRVVDKFITQWGLHGEPKCTAEWRKRRIKDDPVSVSNERGHVSFAMSGLNARSTQIFVNTSDNTALDRQGFAPFGHVTEGMDIIDRVFPGYGDSKAKAPVQSTILSDGNRYLEDEFPLLSFIESIEIEDYEDDN